MSLSDLLQMLEKLALGTGFFFVSAFDHLLISFKVSNFCIASISVNNRHDNWDYFEVLVSGLSQAQTG